MRQKDRTFYNKVLITEGLKLCSTCVKIKTLDNYGIDKNRIHGYRSSCKFCVKNMYNTKAYIQKELERKNKYKLNGSAEKAQLARKNKIENTYSQFREQAKLELIKKKYKQITQNENFYINQYGDIKKIPSKNKMRKVNREIEDVYVRENYHGYMKFNMSGKIWRVHQIVAQEYLEHKMCGHKLVVDHIDGNILNNHYKNLQVVSNYENLMKGKYRKTKEEKFLKYIKDIEF